MNPRWLLDRLSVMSVGEIAHRLSLAVRDRWFVPAWERDRPEAAFARLFRTDAATVLRSPAARRWMRRPAGRAGFETAVAEARALASGNWRLFGKDVRVADPPRWNANLRSGAEWPDLPSRELVHQRTDLAGGAKFAWEFGRLTALPSLALATRAGEGVEHASRAARWLADFTARAPLGRGIHHTSGIEMALRVLTSSATLALLEPEEVASPEAVLGLVAQQALWCRDHPSLGSSANNHLLAELAATVVAGSIWPELRMARALRRGGLERFQEELLRQFLPDGVNAEQAFGYVPFVWEIALLALDAAECAGEAVRPEVWSRLGRSLEFMRTVRLPDGRMPQVGDEDDGRILLAWDGPSRLDLVGNALAARIGADALVDGAGGLAQLLFGAIARAARVAPDGTYEYPYGGWTVWRRSGLLVTFDHGPLGLGPLAAHGHADALSVTVWYDHDGVCVDPGTFAYQEDAAARDRCRSTPVHSTVHFGGRNQSRMLGPFLWGRRATIGRNGEFHTCMWASGERHDRRVTVAAGAVTIEDRVYGRDARLAFALAPGATVELAGARAVVASGTTRATFAGEGLEDWAVEPAEHAPRFADRVPSSRLVALLRGASATTRIGIAPAR